jgi:hypothetical protein
VDSLLQKLGFSGVQAALRVDDYSMVNYDLLLKILLAFEAVLSAACITLGCSNQHH